MPSKVQSTSLHRSFSKALERLEGWSVNPWRRYSLFLIILLTGFFIGSSIGMINGVLALMDPIGAFFTVLILEILVRIRREFLLRKKDSFPMKIIDFSRIGLLYGLLMEGFKLL